MTRYSFYEKRSGKMIFGCAFFLLLLMARDTLVTSCILGFPLSQFGGMGIMILLGALFLAWNRDHIKEILRDRRMVCLAVVTATVLLPMFVKQDWGSLMYFSILLCLFFAIFLTYFISLKQVAWLYVILMAILAVHSLFSCYVLKPIVEAGILTVPSFTNANNYAFYNFGLSFVFALPKYYRNFGIFREPGVYQFFLILALFLNNYTIAWKYQRFAWLLNGIFAVTMLSTFSAVGVVIMIMFAAIMVYDKRWHRKLYEKQLHKNKWFIAAAVLVIAAVLIFAVICIVRKNGIYWTVYSMIGKLFRWDPSTNVRMGAIIADIVIYFQNPIFGAKVSEVMGAVDHNTTSTMLLFCILGVLGGLFSVVCWIVLVWDKKRKTVTNILLLAVLFMSFNTQSLIADVFFWLFPVMAFVERVLPHLSLSKLRIGRKA